MVCLIRDHLMPWVQVILGHHLNVGDFKCLSSIVSIELIVQIETLLREKMMLLIIILKQQALLNRPVWVNWDIWSPCPSMTMGSHTHSVRSRHAIEPLEC